MLKEEFDINDLVYCQSGGKIHAGGYEINSNLLRNGNAPMLTFNDKKMTGGSYGSIFKDLAVPAGLLYLQQNVSGKKFQNKQSDVINDSLFDKLFNLAKVEPIKKLTKKRRNTNKKKTRKNLH
tara:strand:+ start:516 stop:884 length:369 start_codon:yes stop_codon:yes gene_type:complete